MNFFSAVLSAPSEIALIINQGIPSCTATCATAANSISTEERPCNSLESASITNFFL